MSQPNLESASVLSKKASAQRLHDDADYRVNLFAIRLFVPLFGTP